ncbi:MAG: T9SS type A sorting domain-containing protein, partial [Bacteroidia bacterium]|nr:T9SS type A sorting domain-containing protein [Bacteroidia bacterium]
GGGGGGDHAYSVCSDNVGNIIITGEYIGSAIFGYILIQTSSPFGGTFISKLDSIGNFLWTKHGFGTAGAAIISSITNENQDVYSVGYFYEIFYIGNDTLVSQGNSDIMVIKNDKFGNFCWIKTLNSLGQFYAKYIGIDLDGYIYIGGGFEDTLSINGYELISAGNDDAFIAKLDTNGNCKWIKNVCSGVLDDGIYSMKVDHQGFIFLTGSFNDEAYFGDTLLISNGSTDGFILKADSSGTIEWVNSFGGISLDGGYSICFDNNNNIYVEGVFNESAVFGDTTLTCISNIDFSISKLNSSGEFLWTKQMVIPFSLVDDFYINSITSDLDNGIIITGWFKGTMMYEDISLASIGGYDIFVLKIASDGSPLWAMQAGGNATSGDYSRSIARSPEGELYITGRFYDTCWFGDSNVTSYGGADVFIAKLHEEPVSVSYNKTTATFDIALYPNPATDFVNINSVSLQFEKAEIVGINGAVLRSYNKNLNRLDMSDVPAGVCLLRLYSNNCIYIEKIVIQ